MAYNKLSTYKTAWTLDDDGGSVIYTNTAIVRWSSSKIALNSDGWQSVTTKRKMNQASHQFGLGYSVYQRNHVWYVDTPQGETVEYYDGIQMELRT
jgi:hypothetical protein